MSFIHRFSIGAVALVISASASSSHVVAASQRESLLTPVSWLVQHLHDPNLVLLSVGEPGTYPREHIPGAQIVETMSFVSRATSGTALNGEFPADAQLIAVLQRMGITPQSRIVIVESEEWFSPSTRIYITLAHAGFGPNTTLLDGGLKAWKAAGQPVTAEVPTVKPSTIASLTTVPVTVDAAFVQAHLKTPGFVILDGRNPAAWDGVEGQHAGAGGPMKYGHIPGSRSLPLERLWDDPTSRLRTDADLEKEFTAAGVKPGDTVIAYCYVGQRATATLFAAQALGHPVFLYSGSMDEWLRLGLPLEMPGGKVGR